MKTRFLHLAIIASGCVVALPAYAAPAVMHPITRPEVLQHDFKLIWERHKGDEHYRPDVMTSPDLRRSDIDVAKDSTPVAAPEIDPAMGAGALTLLAGGLALLVARRRRAV